MALRLRYGVLQSGRIGDPGDSDGGASPRGFDEHRESEPGHLGQHGLPIKDSQALIADPINDKLTVAARYTDRKDTLELLRYSILLVQNAAAKNSTPAIIDKLARLSETYERIAANGNIKLQLAALVA